MVGLWGAMVRITSWSRVPLSPAIMMLTARSPPLLGYALPTSVASSLAMWHVTVPQRHSSIFIDIATLLRAACLDVRHPMYSS